MKQLQITLPKKFKQEAKKTLEDFSTDISSTDAEKDDEKAVEFTLTTESEQIDELTEKLKGIKDIENGDLSIRVIKQESLIRKGSKTKGSNSVLSQEEIYSKAQESSTFNKAQWGLIVLSSVIASYGLASDNVAVVIGAMMLAPMLSPFISGAFSLTIGDRTLMRDSVRISLLSVLITVLAATIAVIPFPVSYNATLAMVSQPSIIGILLSLLVGAAAALSFATGFRDQIAAVAVAIALVPPLASVGLGVKMFDLTLIYNALSVASINMLSVIVSGFTCFRFLGVTPSTYYKQREARRLIYLIPLALAALLVLSAPIIGASYENYQHSVVQEKVQKEAENLLGDRLLASKPNGLETTLYVVGEFDKTDLEGRVPESARIKVISVEPTS